jgi:hypothetical protein
LVARNIPHPLPVLGPQIFLNSIMAGTRKIPIKPACQIVTWKTTVTKRRIRQKQIPLSQTTPQRAKSTPSKYPVATEDQQHFDPDPIEPLSLPENNVSLWFFFNLFKVLEHWPCQSQNHYLEKFKKRRRAHLARLLQNEAPPSGLLCLSCNVRQCSWKCLDCVGESFLCTACGRSRHRWLPFHRVEHWMGTHFQPAWLCQLGVEIHLGHQGKPCPTITDQEHHEGGAFAELAGNPELDDWEDEEDEEEDTELGVGSGLPQLTGNNVCLIVDKSGVHRLRVHPCRCTGCPPLDLQYLDMGMFPSSLRKVQTAFTFQVLDDFRMDNLECKTSALKYYNKLRRLTSNVYPESIPVSPFLFVHVSVTILTTEMVGSLQRTAPDFTFVA